VEEGLQRGVEEAGVAEVEEAVAAAEVRQRQQAGLIRDARLAVVLWARFSDVWQSGTALHGAMRVASGKGRAINR
jgi:hypothetical protein